MFNLNFIQKAVPHLQWLTIALGIVLLPLFQNCNVNALKGEGSDGGSSVIGLAPPVDHHPPPPVVLSTIETSFAALLSDRRYTLALFEDVFGSTAKSVEGTGIGSNAVEFGAPCSIYENYNVLNASGAVVPVDLDNAACVINSSSAVLGANLVPRPTVIRQAMILKACTNLVLNTATLSHALARISPLEPVPPPTEANVRSLFRLFYVENVEPSAEIVQALQAMMNPSQMSQEAWRAPIYSVCSSNYWQVL